MATNILMPALSPTMTEGKLAKWLKKEGDDGQGRRRDRRDRDRQGDDGGRGGRRRHARQDPRARGHRRREGQRADRGPAGGGRDAVPARRRRRGRRQRREAGARRRSRASAAPRRRPPQRRPPRAAAAAGGRRRAASASSPRRWRGAWREAGGHRSRRRIKGSGPNGRIVKADVEAALKAAPRPAAAPRRRRPRRRRRAPRRRRRSPAPHYVEVPHSSMRKVIARAADRGEARPSRISTSRSTARSTRCWSCASELNAKSPEGRAGAYKLSVNDFVIKAAALALREHPGRAMPRGPRTRWSCTTTVDISRRGRDRRRADHADRPQRRPEGPGARSPAR